jgi:hypothetical protein
MASKVTRLWFVIPNDVKGDGRNWTPPNNGNHWGNEPEEAAPARGNQPRALRGIQNEIGPEAPPQGHGFYLTTKESKEILAFTTKERAAEYAKTQASLNPSKLYGIFGCEQVFETTEPTIIEKKFNDAGELVLSGS